MNKKPIPEKWKKRLIRDLGMQFATPTSKQKKRTIILSCSKCGTDVKATINYLNRPTSNGDCKPCAATTHGFSYHPLVTAYYAMKARCEKKHHASYKDYGGRGITVCKEWKDSKIMFVNWCLSNGYAEGLTIDRRDNNKGYSPENCRFVSRKEQTLNTRRNIKITIDEASEIAEFHSNSNATWKEISKHINIALSTLKQVCTGNFQVKNGYVYSEEALK